ncbi:MULTISPECIES: BUD32 family EKC/KEOPS complex subunit [Vibrio]|uniref:Serine/threonine protein kinase n=2 Tax=Vibrio TaxID=662 RepID=A0A7X4RW60_9VIBR|nr:MULTISPECIES: hypothetical protein [Vibrio]MBF9000916.1 hypothetical protein [Vibrio nitrifigilis]MZI94869.1 hypothetical protein [Vibrio eleionomae]
MSNKHRQVFVYMLKEFEQCDTTYWLKKCGEDKRNVLNRLVNFYFKHRKNRAHLILTSGLTPKERFNKEVSVLEYASNHGLSTPEVVFKGRSMFVTKNAGTPIHRQPEDKQKELFWKATDVLCDFHRNGLIHGRPAMRDIVVNETGKVTFLDFEEARLTSTPSLRTRDFLLFLLDSYRLKGITQEIRLSVLMYWYQEFGENTQRTFHWVESVLNRLGWIAKLVLMCRKNRLSTQLLALRELLREFEVKKRNLEHSVALDH